MATWKPIIGHEGYEASEEGDVRSWWPKGPRAGKAFAEQPRLLKKRPNRNGYDMVAIMGKPVAVHKLVLLAFVGPCPEGMECCHGRKGKKVNSIDNIRWGTRQSNHDDRMEFGNALRGEFNGNSCVSDDVAGEVVAMYASGMTQADIANSKGLSRSTVGNIIRGDTHAVAGGVRRNYVRRGDNHHATKLSNPAMVVKMLNSGMTQKDVASALGVSQSLVSRIKSGERRA